MLNFISLNLKSVGQVMFQGNPLTGLLFLMGISYSAYISESPELILATVLCTVLANLVALILKASPKLLNDGLYGYNGTLIGIAGAVFFEASWEMYGLVILGTLVSVGMMFLILEKCATKISFPALTFPFVLITWILFLIVQWYFPSLLKKSTPVASENFVLVWLLKSFSQVFVLENSITGIIFLLGIFVNSITSGIFSIVGGGITLAAGISLGVDSGLINHGLFGYNAILTAMALGSIFLSTKKEAIIFTAIGLVLTLIYQNILASSFSGIGLPILTAPFVFAVWSVLLFKKIGHRFIK